MILEPLHISDGTQIIASKGNGNTYYNSTLLNITEVPKVAKVTDSNNSAR